MTGQLLPNQLLLHRLLLVRLNNNHLLLELAVSSWKLRKKKINFTIKKLINYFYFEFISCSTMKLSIDLADSWENDMSSLNKSSHLFKSILNFLPVLKNVLYENSKPKLQLFEIKSSLFQFLYFLHHKYPIINKWIINKLICKNLKKRI